VSATSHLQKIGDEIRRLRSERLLSQYDLADLAGVNRKLVGEVERAETDPAHSSLWAIANALGVPLSVIMASAERADDRS
jgi:transcriptional regulator with XRE-family HTH domain